MNSSAVCPCHLANEGALCCIKRWKLPVNSMMSPRWSATAARIFKVMRFSTVLV